MSEPTPEGEDKKLPLKPRRLKSQEGFGSGAEAVTPPKLTSSLTAKSVPSGAPFEARAHTRAKPPVAASDTPAKESAAAAAPAPPAHAPEPTRAPADQPAARRPPNPGSRRLLLKLVRRRIRLWQAAPALLAFSGLVGWGAFAAGKAAGQSAALQAAAKQGIEIPADVQTRIDQALADLRSGDASKALEELQPVEQANPDVSSLTYLVALAAMQAGEQELSEKKTDESIAKRERISDSLALKAVLETQKQIRGFGDPSIRSEAYLRRAMAADAANPHPIIELATLLRYRQRDEEAARLLAAARSRLNPVDSHAVVETTLSLMDLQVRGDDALPDQLDPDKDISSLFSAAYVAMRKGDYDRAAKILRVGKDRLPPDFFDYLVNDPALRKFSTQAQLQEFYQ